MGIFNVYRKWENKRTEKERVVLRQEIQDEIQIDLRNNTLWLVVGGEAIYKVKQEDTAESIIKRAEEVFATAKEYKEL